MSASRDSASRDWAQIVGRVIVVGSYNASLSVFSNELPTRGQTVLGSRLDIGPGGKGNNQAIGARRLGADVSFVVKLGRDYFAGTARSVLEGEGLSSSWILDSPTDTGVALIMVDAKGDNLISVAPGANDELQVGEVTGLVGLVDGASHLLCQLECSLELFVDVARSGARVGTGHDSQPGSSPAIVARCLRIDRHTDAQRD